MSPNSKRILTVLILLLPVFVAGILTKNVTLDILPILIVAGFACWVAIHSKRSEKGEL